MQVSVILILHQTNSGESLLDTVRERFYTLLSKAIQDVDVKVVELRDLDEVRRVIQDSVTYSDQVLVCPLLVRHGQHYRDIVKICEEISGRTGRRIDVLPPLLEQPEIVTSIAAQILRKCLPFQEKYDILPVLSSTGDVELMLELESNRELSQLTEVASRCRDLVVDDLRIVTFIDTKYLRPGTRVLMEENVESFSFPPESLVVISSKVRAVERVLALVEDGIRPNLVIATPPCKTEEEVQLKRKLLSLDVPVIVSSSYRGGVHVAGSVLNTLMRLASTSLS